MNTAHDVIVAALSIPLPCPECGRAETCRCVRPPGHSPVEQRAAVIEAALVQHGHLSNAREVTQADLDEAAMYLAARSRHPRYTQTTDGWTKLLQAAADVEVAYAQALDRSPQSEHESLGAAKALLLGEHDRRASKAED